MPIWGPNEINILPSTAIFDGHQTATNSAVALNGGTSQPCQSVVVQNDPSSGAGNDIYVGNATSQSIRLQPGDTEALGVSDVNLVYIVAVAGSPRVNWHARS